MKQPFANAFCQKDYSRTSRHRHRRCGRAGEPLPWPCRRAGRCRRPATRARKQASRSPAGAQAEADAVTVGARAGAPRLHRRAGEPPLRACEEVPSPPLWARASCCRGHCHTGAKTGQPQPHGRASRSRCRHRGCASRRAAAPQACRRARRCHRRRCGRGRAATTATQVREQVILCGDDR